MIGILYPGYAAEDDYGRLAEALVPPVQVRVVHTETPDRHEVEECLKTGSEEFLTTGAETLRDDNVQVCMWACTSGSFVYGLEGARRQAQNIARVVQAPTSSTSLAFLEAVKTLKLLRVAVAATYPVDLAGAFRAFLGQAGVEVVHLGCLGVWSGADAGRIGRDAVLHFARQNDHPDADAVLIPDTALHTTAFLQDLEDSVGKTVLTANQVTLWNALRLSGHFLPQRNLGRLMSISG